MAETILEIQKEQDNKKGVFNRIMAELTDKQNVVAVSYENKLMHLEGQMKDKDEMLKYQQEEIEE